MSFSSQDSAMKKSAHKGRESDCPSPTAFECLRLFHQLSQNGQTPTLGDSVVGFICGHLDWHFLLLSCDPKYTTA